jgi:predicted ester cyclase
VDNASVLREVIERGFGEGDLSVAERYAADSMIEHEYAAPTGTTGAEILRAMIEEARSAMPGLRMQLEDLVIDGDKVWARSIGRAPNPAGGAELTITVLDVCRFEDGRIAEHWGVPDRFALLHQLGALPPPRPPSSPQPDRGESPEGQV